MPRINEPIFKDPLENPAAANAEISKLLEENGSDNQKPAIEYPPSDLVTLPGGYVNDDGEVIREVQVKELTGADEELMARAIMSNNPIHFTNTVLECGIVRVGNESSNRTHEILQKMLIGDKEQLFVGIRIATYGDEVEIKDWICPFCNKKSDLTIHLDEDVKVRKLNDPKTESSFEVPLRKGGYVTVRLLTGADQNSLWDKDSTLTKPEIDSKILSMVVQEIFDDSGARINMALVPDMARKFGLIDRKKILKELMDRQPGPQLNAIDFNCDGCGEKVTLAVGLEELFLNFELL